MGKVKSRNPGMAVIFYLSCLTIFCRVVFPVVKPHYLVGEFLIKTSKK